MTKYIDQATLVAEIKKRIKGLKDCHADTVAGYTGEISGLERLLSFIDTLKVKEVDLEKEIDKIWNPRFNLGWDEKSLLSMNHEGFTTIAKYFYELGLKAQKGE